MLRPTTVLAGCLVFVATSSVASAVTVDLSSPQEGQVLYPGDAIVLTINVTNDTGIPDRVVAKVSVEINGVILGCQGTGALQADLLPGASATKTVTLTIPKKLVITEPVTGTASVLAIGRRSGTEANDSLTFTVEP